MMRVSRYFVAVAAGAVALSGLVVTGACAQPAAKKNAAPAAQSKSAPPMAAPAAAPAPKQIALTEKQIEQTLAAQKDMDAIAEKMPDAPNAKPDPKLMQMSEDTAKKFGFASFAEYNDVVDNISMVLGGFDPKTKTYVGQEAMIKAQIATIQGDKKIPAKEKKEALADLNEALKTPAPAIENKGNIDLVGKYYDKLSAAMQEDE